MKYMKRNWFSSSLFLLYDLRIAKNIPLVRFYAPVIALLSAIFKYSSEQWPYFEYIRI